MVGRCVITILRRCFSMYVLRQFEKKPLSCCRERQYRNKCSQYARRFSYYRCGSEKKQFVRRLIKLDRETYERSADIGASGEPAPGDFALRRMITKRCSLCSQPAQYSLASVVSTVGVSPRRQKCSSIVLLCDGCMRELCERLAPVSSEMREALKRAYTAMNSAPASPCDLKES